MTTSFERGISCGLSKREVECRLPDMLSGERFRPNHLLALLSET
jgi:hypothetical protein